MSARPRSCSGASSISAADGPDAAQLRAHLEALAARGETATYQQVARALDLAPPRSVHRLTQALENLMAEDVAAGRPPLAAVVVSRTRAGMPAPGFFARLRELGAYSGPERGEAAAAHHRELLAAVFHRYRSSD